MRAGEEIVTEHLFVRGAGAGKTIPWTRTDLDRLPDDGNRYELLNGELLVSPAPSPPHQQIVAWLSDVLTPFVARHRIGIVHQAPSVMVRGDSTQVEPDLMVLPRVSFETWDAAPVPLLVIEVLSRSTSRRDLNQKRDFAAMFAEVSSTCAR
jgi:Uma2 family endonuclease